MKLKQLLHFPIFIGIYVSTRYVIEKRFYPDKEDKFGKYMSRYRKP